MPGLIGKKVGMTSVFDESGNYIPCTVLETGPCVVTQVKTEDKDGYEAVQLSYGDVKEKSVNQPQLGHFKKAGTTPKRKLVEFNDFDEEYALGDVLTVDYFKDDIFVDVAGMTKGKGFQGVVKRHGFHGVNDQTHGQHDRKRAPGSIGASSFPSRVFKGMRMGGRTGNAKRKIMNLKIVKVIPESNVLVVKGSVPGAKGSYVIIEK